MKAETPYTHLLPAGIADDCFFVSAFGLGCMLVVDDSSSSNKHKKDAKTPQHTATVGFDQHPTLRLEKNDLTRQTLENFRQDNFSGR